MSKNGKMAASRLAMMGADDRIYIEHRYLYDAEDIRQQRAGSAFLEQHPMADLELVHSPEVYHSLAEVIDGKNTSHLCTKCSNAITAELKNV